MKKLFVAVLCLVAIQGHAQKAEFFTPVHQNALRLPSVPLITVDPYFSLWSKYDHLYDGSVSHWTGRRKPLNGAIYIDNKAYRFMGESLEPLAAVASEKAWTGKYVTSTPSGSWTSVDYDDNGWQSGAAPWGDYDECATSWSGDNTDIWIRRSFDLEEINTKAMYYLMYKHDDVFELYINGTRVVSTGATWNSQGATIEIDRGLLRTGKNVLACHCHNTYGGALADMGAYMSVLPQAEQKSCTVTATSTYYTFTCGTVDLDVVFTTPQLMDDLTLFSTPIAYISYQAKTNDGKKHNVRVMFETSAEMAIRNSNQATLTRRKITNGYEYFYAYNKSQNVLSHTDDYIDWGYLYTFSDRKTGHSLKLGERSTLLHEFASKGTITSQRTSVECPGGTYYSIMYLDSLGVVNTGGKRSFTMIGYDDTYSIRYFGSNRKGYWANNGKTNTNTNITSRFEDLYQNYNDIMQRCRMTDMQIYSDGYATGGTKYAEILASVYRQTNAAHKLFADSEGNLMFMSRENYSGGFINTLDVTYPSQPLYWIYSPALAKAMITPVFKYCASGRWDYDFPNHDLGHYPIAEGNHYGNPADGSGSTMPVEQSGNMLTLAAIIATQDHDLDYLRTYLPYMTKWANYLVANGKDPANQLCTDDFMGHSARNTNLAVKAIMGVMSYSEICRMLGDEAKANEYRAKAQEMVDFWKQNAYSTNGGNHYLLNFGANSDTWSTKYNLVWDKIWGWNIMEDVRNTEISFYTNNKMKTYGLLLDSRGDLCKSDWQMWAMGFADQEAQRTKLVNTLWKYINETKSRVPVSDNHYASSGDQAMFQARSVVGGYWMRVFVDQFLDCNRTSISSPQFTNSIKTNGKCFDLSGREVTAPFAPGIYIKDGKKFINK